MAVLLTGSFLMGTASPALAAESAAPVLEPKSTLAEAASAKVESLSSEAVANAAAQGATATQNTDSEGFFKTGKGKAVLVLMIAATGFTVYSKYNDRIKSVIR
jgi:hypothetical protein